METPADQDSGSGEGRPVRAAALCICAATAAAYSASLGAPLIYDDRIWITGNPFIRSLGSLGQVLLPPGGSGAAGRPLLSLSFALNYAAGGENPVGYHLANLAIHGAAALVLLGVVRRTLARLPGAFPTPSDRLLPALGAALLWALHPLQTEAVTYVSQRSESLMGLLYLVALYGFIRGTEAGGGRRWLGVCVAACLLGMATKEVMVTAPLLILAYDRTFVSGSVRGALGRRPGLYAALGLTWVLLLALAPGLRGRGVGLGLGYTWWSYGLLETWVVGHYLLLALWPFPLVLDRGAELGESLRGALPWALALLALAGASLAGFLRRLATGFAAAALFLVLAPTSSVVPVAFQPMAEHRMYLPLAALASMAAAGSWAWLGRRSLAPLALAALLLGAATFLRNRDYRDEVTIWQDTVSRVPANERAQLALGSALARAHRDAEAAAAFAEAARLAPGDMDARLGLGLELFALGRPADAVAAYRAIAPSRPGSYLLHLSLGRALEALGQRGEAAREYAAAQGLDPADPRAGERLRALGPP
jgi:Flp pilus assembly protein TadD